MTMTGEEIYRNFTEGSTVMLDCAGSDVSKLATTYQQIGSGLKRAQRMMMASWTGGAALPAWAAATDLANAIKQSADRLTSYGEAHKKQAAAFETASRTVVVVPPEPAALNPFEVAAEVFKTGNPAAPFEKIREHQAAVDAHHAASEINKNVMVAYEKATSGHTIPDDYPTLTVTGHPDNTIDHETTGGDPRNTVDAEDDGRAKEDGDPEEGGGEREGGGPVPAGVATGTGSAGGSDGDPGGFGIGDVGGGGVDPGDVDLDDLPPNPDTDPGRTDPSQAPPGPSNGPFGPPTYHGPPPPGPPPITDPGPPPTGPPPGTGGSSGSGGSGTQAARANASGRTGQLDGSDLPGAVPWSAGAGDPSGENARGGAGQGAGRGMGIGAGVPGAAGGWRTGPAGGPRGAGGPGAFGGAPLSGRKEEDEEHARPDYLIEPDPDELFGSDERASSPVIGDSWKSE
jgi:hypothetical protein